MTISINYLDRVDEEGNPRNDPIVEVKICLDNEEKTVFAYADTGFDLALSLPKRIADDLELPDSAKVYETNMINADGHPSPVYIYRLKGKIAGMEEQEIFVSVSQEDTQYEDQEGVMSPDEPLLGRNLFDRYNVSFLGKSRPRKLSIS